MSAKNDSTTSKAPTPAKSCGLRVTTRAGHDGQLPEDVTPEQSCVRWTQGEAPDRTGFIAWGEAIRIETIGPNRFAVARQQLAEVLARADIDDAVKRPGSGLVAFGAFAFDDTSSRQSFLIIPRHIHAFDGTTAWNTTLEVLDGAGQNLPAEPGQGKLAEVPSQTTHLAAQQELPIKLAARQELPVKLAARQELPIKLAARQELPIKLAARMSSSGWLAAVATAIQRIKNRELDKVVLARAIDVTMATPIDEMALADKLGPAYPQCWTYAMDGLVGATPEMLVKVRGGSVMSRVLAGTISRRDDVTPPANDAHKGMSDVERAEALGTSQKDHGEHHLAVASVADALQSKGIEVDIPKQPFVLELPNVMHLATDLQGQCPEGITALDLAEALHPSAAVCGTPTKKAFATIAELEELDRGLYSGPVGWVDGLGNGEWGIALRSGQICHEDARQITLYAGCGIVADSIPAEELAETEAKFLPMRDALGLPPTRDHLTTND